MEATNGKIEGNFSCWYVICTVTRKEKSLKDCLEQDGIRSYLPSQKVIRLWNNRKKEIEIPVVSKLIFVYLTSSELEKLKKQNLSFLMKNAEDYITISEEAMADLQEMMVKSEGSAEKSRVLLSQMGLE